jgi:hypothetical protein
MIYMQVEAENLRQRGVKVRWFHFLWHPVCRMFKAYLLDGGFRDGTVGLISALHVFAATFNHYATAWDQSNAIARDELEERVRQLWQRASRARAASTR